MDGLTQSPMESLEILYGLKSVKRTGWLRRGVPPELCESSAAHSLHVIQAAYFFTGGDTANYDLVDMMAMHDWPEAITGDPTPHDGLDPKVKHDLEHAAMIEITHGIPDGKKCLDTWLEYDAAQTPNAIIAKQLDKLDAAVKALYYESLGFKSAVSDFYPYTREKLTDPRLIRVFERLMKRDFPLEKSHLAYFLYLGAEKERSSNGLITL
ncbi:MAG: HD domain-containing protein [Nanoarchaeota archaeon]